MSRIALITGITGQDGSYLAEFLLNKGYSVHGVVRRVALEDPGHRMGRIQHILKDLHLHVASLESPTGMSQLLKQVKPDELYHLAANSFVGYSLEEEVSTLHTNITSTHAVLSSVREVCPGARVYFAGSSEMFGRAKAYPQNEATPFHPRSAYGISKCSGFFLTQSYRESYGFFAVSGILFNHESPRRGFEFVSRKISSHVALIASGKEVTLRLGNLDARRDWGHAQRYVEAIWLMMQTKEPQDYVIATGQTHTVRQFCEIAFRLVNRDYQDHIETDPALFRPTEEIPLVGDASLARQKLGWSYDIPFESLVQEMVEHDLGRIKEGTRHQTADMRLET